VVEVWNGRWTSDRPWNADNEAAVAEWAAAWLQTSAVGGGGRRWATATPIWNVTNSPILGNTATGTNARGGGSSLAAGDRGRQP
jgi:hypothetical protein